MKKIRLAEANGRTEIPMQTRLAPVGTVDAKTRTAELVWSTGARVQRYDWWNDETYFEELSMDPAHVRLGRLQSGAPLLDTHNRYDLSGVLGVVEGATVRIEGGQGKSAVRFSERAEVTPIFNDVAGGIIRNVSIGYVVHKYEQSRTPDGVLVMRAVDWEPSEISLVPVGADAGAGVRAEQREQQRTFPCEIVGRSAGGEPAVSATTRKDPSMKTKEELAAEAAEAARKQEEQTRAEQARKDAEKAAADAQKAERERVVVITELGTRHALAADFVQKLITEGKSVDAARAAVLDELAKKSSETIRSGHIGIETISDETVNRRAAMVDALMHRSDPGRYKLEERAKPFVGYTLRELMRKCLEIERAHRGHELQPHVGAHVRVGLRPAEHRARRGQQEPARGLRRHAAHVRAVDPPVVRRGLQEHQPHPPLGRPVAARGEVGRRVQARRGDRRQGNLRADDLRPDPRHQPPDRSSTTTWAPSRGCRRSAPARRRTWSRTRCTASSPRTPTWRTAWRSSARDAQELHLERHRDRRHVARRRPAAMRKQTGLEGRPINVRPSFLIVPAAKETLAQQYTSVQFVPAQSATINPFAQGKPDALTPIAEPRLDANSATAWYLAADPAADRHDRVRVPGRPAGRVPRVAHGLGHRRHRAQGARGLRRQGARLPRPLQERRRLIGTAAAPATDRARSAFSPARRGDPNLRRQQQQQAAAFSFAAPEEGKHEELHPARQRHHRRGALRRHLRCRRPARRLALRRRRRHRRLGATGVFWTDGVFELTKLSGAAEAFTLGKRVYWDDTNKRLTVVSTSNVCVGVVTEAAATDAVVARIKLGGTTPAGT
jgi:hypothetical protein